MTLEQFSLVSQCFIHIVACLRLKSLDKCI